MSTEQNNLSNRTDGTEVICRIGIFVLGFAGLFLIAVPPLRLSNSSPKVIVTSVTSVRPTEPRLKTKPIEMVKAGEKVWAYDPVTGNWSAREVIRPMEREYDGDVVNTFNANIREFNLVL